MNNIWADISKVVMFITGLLFVMFVSNTLGLSGKMKANIN